MKKFKEYSITSRAGLIYLICFISLEIFALILIFSNTKMDDNSFKIFYTFFSQLIIFGILPTLLLILTSKNDANIFHSFQINKKIEPKVVVVVIIFSIFSLIIAGTLNSIFLAICKAIGIKEPDITDQEKITFAKYLLSIVTSCLLPAIFEEWLHRGLLYGYLKKEFTANKSIVISGLIFGLMHNNIQQLCYTTICGILIAYVVYSTGNFIYGCIMHFVNNFYVTTVEYLNEQFSMQKSLDSFIKTPLGVFIKIIGLIALAILFYYALRYISNLYKKSRNKSQMDIDFKNLKELRLKTRDTKIIFSILILIMLVVNFITILLYNKVV